MLDQKQRQGPNEPAPWERKEPAPFEGPKPPNVQKPDTSSIIKKLKTVSPDQSKRYRQRTGQ